MTQPLLEVPRDAIVQFCRRHHVRRLALFGSALRDDFRPDSDIDVVVEFDAAHIPGLEFFSIQDELSAMFGRNVDLNTPKSLSPYFRDQVVSEAEVLYDSP